MLPAIVSIVLVVPPTIVGCAQLGDDGGRDDEANDSAYSSSVNSLLRSARFRLDMVPSPLRPWCRTVLSDATSRSTALVRYQACGAGGRFLLWLLWVRSGVLCPQTQCEEVAARTGPRFLPVSAVEVGAPVPVLWAPAPLPEVVISHTDRPQSNFVVWCNLRLVLGHGTQATSLTPHPPAWLTADVDVALPWCLRL